MYKLILAVCFAFLAIAGVEAAPPLAAPETAVAANEIGGSFLRPFRKVLVEWNIAVNREIPKRMKELRQNPSPWIILTSILAAFAYGVLHTLGPGHGKMVVASYFLTQGAHFWRGAFVGAQVALSHVGGAVALVFATDIAMRALLTDPESQVFWVRTISYSLIMVIGLAMLVQAMRHAFGLSAAGACTHCNHGHAHPRHKTRREMLLSWCVGAVPCTGSLLILLYAMAHNVVWMGIAMVMCVALGMAVAMTTIGIICISGKKHIVDRYLAGRGKGHVGQVVLETGGALFIVLVGLMLLLSVVL